MGANLSCCYTDVKEMKKAEDPKKMGKRKSVLKSYAPYPSDYDPPFPIEMVGTFSNHGIEPDFSNNAIVKANQDRGSVDFPFAGNNKCVLFCCLDGHGRQGHKVSQFAVETMHSLLEKDEARLHVDHESALKDAFEITDRKLKASDINSESSGSSAVAVFLDGDTLKIANAGDSRAVIGKRQAGLTGTQIVHEDLTWDQKPDSDGEQHRIVAAGGIVTPPEDVGLSSRVWTSNMRYGLSMSRSIGDHILAANGVIATPEVTQRKLTASDEFMIIATDGIWEFIESDKAVEIVAKHKNATEACYELIHTATAAWRAEEGDYRDDITALVVFLGPLRAHISAQQGTVDSILSPTSNDLRLHKKKQQLFKDGEEMDPPVPGKPSGTSQPVSPASPLLGKGSIDKAKTFRKRRLSMTPAANDIVAAAVKQHDAAEAAVPPMKERKRRLSISPDMDQSGQQLNPQGMGPSQAPAQSP